MNRGMRFSGVPCGPFCSRIAPRPLPSAVSGAEFATVESMALATPVSKLLWLAWKSAVEFLSPAYIADGFDVMMPQTVFDSSCAAATPSNAGTRVNAWRSSLMRSEEHTSELQSLRHL